jgi:ferredoxin-NADP reductase
MFTGSAIPSRSSRSRWPRRLVAVLDALATPHGIDRYLELIDPAWSVREVRAVVTETRRQTASSVTLTLEPNANWTGFEAGQYTVLTVEIDGVRHSRCYSVATSAHLRRRFELTVKRQPGGTVSPYLYANAQRDMLVGLSPAQGDFTLPAVRPDRLMLISGGSGITPAMSMLRTLCDEDHTGLVAFVHYSLRADDMPYQTELARLAADHPNVRLLRAFTEEPGRGELDGLFCDAHLLAADRAWRHAETYVCGPAPLMDAVRARFEQEGLSDRLHMEAFTQTFPVSGSGVGACGTVRFERSGAQIDADGRTLLELAEAAGLRPIHGCRMGICHTCTRHMPHGTVRDLRTGITRTAVDTDVQLCVHVPDGDVALDL